MSPTTTNRLLRGPARILLPVLPLLSCIPSLLGVGAFDITANTNLALYWGQNSYGRSHPNDTATCQRPLAHFCQNTTSDIIPISSLDQFYSIGGLPSFNLSHTCNASNSDVFAGTALANCSFLEGDIQTCQAAGKAVTLSFGRQNDSSAFANDTQGATFANTIWDLFLGGSSASRPFGNAVLDGINMDVQGGNQTGLVAFLTTLRDLMNSTDRRYYITATSPCAYPDGDTLNAFPFDAVFVQFYNSSCGLDRYNTTDWDFGVWDSWAKTASPNPNVKVYIGAPASPSAASSGYVNASTLATIIEQTRSTYSSFGGVALQDASQAYANNRYDILAKDALTATSAITTTKRDVSSTCGLPWQMNVTYGPDQQVSHMDHHWTAISTSHNDVPGGAGAPWDDNGPCVGSTTASAPSSPCTGNSTWQPDVAYTAGQQVSYSGNIWVAKYWSFNDMPGGDSGVWMDLGSCTTSLTCDGVSAWQWEVAYTAGQQVTFNGDLWTAKWWSMNDVPDGPGDSWMDNGACPTSSTTSAPTLTTASMTSSSMTSSPTDTTSTTATSASSSTTDTTSNTATSTASSTTDTTSTTPTTPFLRNRQASPTSSTTITSSAPTTTSISCTGVQMWQRNVMYEPGEQVTFNGHLWTAARPSYEDLPDASALGGIWTDNGACSTDSATF